MAGQDFATTLTMTECGACGLLFKCATNARAHVALPKCSGAALVKTLCGVVKLPGTHQPTRGGRRAAPVPVHGNQNSAQTVHDNSVHVENMIVLGNAHGDIVRAGSARESDLIRRTILENADLRRMIRTIENAPAAIFRMTKGRNGPRCMRNARKSGGQVEELTAEGVRTTGTIEYCKRAAGQMVDELRRAVDSVSPTSPAAVREWADDVRRELGRKLCGELNYVQALRLYCDASSRFWKLPRVSREAIACGVRNIATFVAETAVF